MLQPTHENYIIVLYVFSTYNYFSLFIFLPILLKTKHTDNNMLINISWAFWASVRSSNHIGALSITCIYAVIHIYSSIVCATFITKRIELQLTTRTYDIHLYTQMDKKKQLCFKRFDEWRCAIARITEAIKWNTHTLTHANLWTEKKKRKKSINCSYIQKYSPPEIIHTNDGGVRIAHSNTHSTHADLVQHGKPWIFFACVKYDVSLSTCGR